MNATHPFPKVLRIEPASQCNLACAHCPTGTVDMRRDIMQESTFEKIICEVTLHKEHSFATQSHLEKAKPIDFLSSTILQITRQRSYYE